MSQEKLSQEHEGKASRNKRVKREALLQSAYDLFTEKGYARTTIEDITKHAGVAKGTYYLYYKDKEDIRRHLIQIKSEEVLRKAYNAMLEEYGGVLLTNMEELVIFFAENILNQLTQDRVLLGFVNQNLAWGLVRPIIGATDPFAPDIKMSLLDVLVQLFRNSPVKYRDPEVTLYMIVEFFNAACYSSIMESIPRPIEEFRPQLLDAIRGILRSQEIPPEKADAVTLEEADAVAPEEADAVMPEKADAVMRSRCS